MKKKNEYIKSDPYFFRMIIVSALLVIIAVIVLGLFIDAPLKAPADSSNVPNPSKAAWFLLWFQEIVSYSSYFIYGPVILFIVYLFLPYLAPSTDEKAVWFRKEYRLLDIFTLLVFLGIVFLTVIAYFFRGEFWRLTI
ncbi:hypothetical protein Flexsi_1376 [Flexistipes sinusarabici DSM 4947]|uniref:Cytochrome B6 n=1 Tax=Flexistipes sinusarabici (strain ATCC 49648 / DSM 4947 / MAS 10) TaxID=717231 RepID=F8E7V8_FLESM|nr:selenite/tellurite reduction operon b-type cytochrome membrane protein ExtQ [Flexistipes sinusarabici]AEI15026.1 hypothetical protein Flexsi_1376 [Flexistipes sinusarabici DSM 4947]